MQLGCDANDSGSTPVGMISRFRPEKKSHKKGTSRADLFDRGGEFGLGDTLPRRLRFDDVGEEQEGENSNGTDSFHNQYSRARGRGDSTPF